MGCKLGVQKLEEGLTGTKPQRLSLPLEVIRRLEASKHNLKEGELTPSGGELTRPKGAGQGSPQAPLPGHLWDLALQCDCQKFYLFEMCLVSSPGLLAG